MVVDSDEGAWLATVQNGGTGLDVGSFVPHGFAQYLRIFHPAFKAAWANPDVHGSGKEYRMQPVRWRDIASANGRSIAEEMRNLPVDCRPSRFGKSNAAGVAGHGDTLWDSAPQLGRLPAELATTLVSILARYTSRADCVFWGLWDGYAIEYPADVVFELERAVSRHYVVYERTLDDVIRSHLPSELNSGHPPNLWWPADRTWCVATEIGFRWTYVGCSEACASDILSDPRVEAVLTHLCEGNQMQD